MSTLPERFKRVHTLWRMSQRMNDAFNEWIVKNAFHTDECNEYSAENCNCGLGQILDTYDFMENFKHHGKVKDEELKKALELLPNINSLEEKYSI